VKKKEKGKESAHNRVEKKRIDKIICSDIRIGDDKRGKR